MRAGERRSEAFIVAGKASKVLRAGKRLLNHPAPSQEDKTTFCFLELHDFQTHPVGRSLRRRLRSGVSLIHRGHLDRVLGRGLDLPRQVRDLRALQLIGRSNLLGQQMPQGIYCDMHFAALAPVVAIVAAACSALQGGLRGAVIEDDSAELRVPVGLQP